MNTLTDFLYAKAAKNKIPFGGAFELSPVCNFRCKMCYVRKTSQQLEASGQHLHDWKEWLELARKAKEEGLFYLLLTGGEPFLYPHFRELYEALHDMGLLLSINTNGSMLDEETIAWLKKKAPTRVNITLYGCSEETYGRICGNPSAFPKVVKAIKDLKAAGIPVVMNASMIPENACDLEGIIDFGKSMEINTRMATYMFPPVRRDQEESDSRFTPKESAMLYLRKQRHLLGERHYLSFLKKNMAILEEDQKKWKEEKQSVDKAKTNEEKQSVDKAKADKKLPDHKEYMTCRAGRSSFWVSWDGNFTACGITSFPKVYQDIFTRDFKKAWLELTELTRHTPVLKECYQCENRTLCKPCAAILDAETGSVNRKSEYHCQMTEELIRLIHQDIASLERIYEEEDTDQDHYENDVKFLCE